MKRLKSKSNHLIGVDISSTAVKIVDLSRTQGRFLLNCYGIEPLPTGAVVDKNIADVDAVGDAINKLSQRIKLTSNSGAAAVSDAAVITKIIDMPRSLSDTEREAQIRLDADQYIPYPLDEVNLDFEVLGKSSIDEETVQVLLAASRTENVEQRRDALMFGGIEAKVIDIEAHAIERAFNLIIDGLPGSPELVALFDIGHQQTTLYVFQNNKVIYNREQLFGGAQLTEAIQNRYGMSFEEATNNKRNDSLPDDYHTEILEPFMDNVVQQITRSLQFYFSSSQFHDIDHIVLSGGTAALPNLANLVEDKVGNQVTIANPFAHMGLSNKVMTQELGVDAPGLMIACGLALRSFD